MAGLSPEGPGIFVMHFSDQQALPPRIPFRRSDVRPQRGVRPERQGRVAKRRRGQPASIGLAQGVSRRSREGMRNEKPKAEEKPETDNPAYDKTVPPLPSTT